MDTVTPQDPRDQVNVVDQLPQTMEEAYEFYQQSLQQAQDDPHLLWEAERWLARNDLFYLMVAVMKRKDVAREWLFERCREIQREPNGHIDLWSREHYKSTLITVGLSIQNILNDPNITIGIFSHTRPIAKAFLRQIKRELEGNEDLRRLFPEIIYAEPHRESQKWSEDDGIIVHRQSNKKEATVEAWGLVDGQPTSKHFDLLVYDDVVTVSSVTTPDMIRKTTDAWRLSLNLGADDGARRIIGTFYHFGDTYHDIIERGSAIPRIYPATKDGAPDGEPVLLKPEVLHQKRRDMGPYIFSCQMLLNPVADQAQGFKQEWLRYWPARNHNNLNLYILVDPASSKKESADYTTIIVLGTGEDEIYRVVDMVRDRLNLKERTDKLFEMHRLYRPLNVGYEEYGLQADIEHIKEKQDNENYKFRITKVGGRMAKEERIRRLIPLFEDERMLLPEVCFHTNCEGVNEDLIKIFVNQEYLAFPVSHHDDQLDALSRLFDIQVRFPSKRKAEARPTHTKTAMKRLRK